MGAPVNLACLVGGDACAVGAATPLAWALLAIAVIAETFSVRFDSARISGSFAALVVAMALLGPVPAALIAVTAVTFDALRTRRPTRESTASAAVLALAALAGGWATATIGDEDPLAFASVVVLVFLFTSATHFAAVALLLRLGDGRGLRDSYTVVYRAMLPFELATALLTAGVVYSYERLGFGAIALLVVVLFVFHHLARTCVKAYERGQELVTRGRELSVLQVGVLSTVLQTLSMRDAMTARHSAAVARYSREVARMLGLSEREQDLIHTAGLLHDIGKFILPDSVLFANRTLSDDEWTLIRLHPEQGARLVERIEGYGPVAEIVLHHHERFAGGGYPHGIAGEQIPLGSRIIAVADTYDVLTARDSYRRPVSSEDALAEIRRVAGTQLDPAVAVVFERMIREQRVAFSHSDETDFQLELDTRSIKALQPATDLNEELRFLTPRGNAV